MRLQKEVFVIDVQLVGPNLFLDRYLEKFLVKSFFLSNLTGTVI